MANGIEDFKEKEKDSDSNKIDMKKSEVRHWTNYQGREDAEMLQEKTSGWSAIKSNRGDYDDSDY